MKTPPNKLLILLSLGLMISGCADQYQRIEQSVIHGDPVQSGSPLANATVSIIASFEDEPQYLCTGVLISPRLVLTAAHCLMDMSTDPLLDDRRYVFFGVKKPMDYENKNLYEIKNVVIHPNLIFDENQVWTEQGQKEAEYHFDQNDLALIFLDRDAPKSTQPAPILANPEILKPGMGVTVVGNGLTNELKQTFAQRLNSANLNIVQIDQNMLVLDQTHQQGACSGDSGGPVYLKSKKGLFIVGIVKGPYGAVHHCGHLGQFTIPGKQIGYLHRMMNTLKLKKEWLPRFVRLSETDFVR